MLTKKKRSIVFAKYNGRCAYCGCELQKGWHIDHLKPINRVKTRRYDREQDKFIVKIIIGNPENDCFENMVPSCPSCNNYKSNYTIEMFRQGIKEMVESLNRYTQNYKFAKKFGLVEETGKPVLFYFETLEDRHDPESDT
jgi:5-methylcytosine-specific restriction endonuclease McrA